MVCPRIVGRVRSGSPFSSHATYSPLMGAHDSYGSPTHTTAEMVRRTITISSMAAVHWLRRVRSFPSESGPRLDAAFSGLIEDLSKMPGKEPGKTLLDETMVCMIHEFGR